MSDKVYLLWVNDDVRGVFMSEESAVSWLFDNAFDYLDEEEWPAFEKSRDALHDGAENCLLLPKHKIVPFDIKSGGLGQVLKMAKVFRYCLDIKWPRDSGCKEIPILYKGDSPDTPKPTHHDWDRYDRYFGYSLDSPEAAKEVALAYYLQRQADKAREAIQAVP
jgi:hypothetical protein